ncbi:MAG: hypothetical protein KGL39_10775 [Patescibacteria group bacterium]|nr:hypothetical protein [Patescibacteria group bacterium]
MPLSWNDVEFREYNVGLPTGSPKFSLLPAQESRLSMRGWFEWDDMIDQGGNIGVRAAKAFAGWVQTAFDYRPEDQNGNPLPGVAAPDPALAYFNYTLPFAHPDYPNQWFLCEGFAEVEGHVPNAPSIGPNGTATFDRALTTLSFKSPMNGYRVLPDFMLLDQVATANQHPGFIPREYFCLRNMEITEDVVSRAQTIPGNSGLKWQVLAGPTNISVTATNFINLHKGEIKIVWYPVPFLGYNEAAALDLIGKSNDAPFPPTQPLIPGVQPPPSLLTQRGGQKALATLIWGQPKKEIIRTGSGDYAYKITFRMDWWPFGANAFFWADPPPAVRGRIRIDPANGPTPDPALGGPGYYPTGYPNGGGNLFPSGNFKLPFLPNGQTV